LPFILSHVKIINILFLLLLGCTSINVNKNIEIALVLPGDSVKDNTTLMCQVPNLLIPVNITYITTSDLNLKDFLKSDADVTGLPGF